MDREVALKLIVEEMERATALYGPFNSAHEGWAVIREEEEELWDEVKFNPMKLDFPPHMYARGYSEEYQRAWKKHKHGQSMAHEAVQIAAMALRFLIDLCPDKPEEDPPKQHAVGLRGPKDYD
jgi:hypothetical protein